MKAKPFYQTDPAKDPILNKILEKHPLEYTGHIFPEFKTKDALLGHVQSIRAKFPERAKRAYDSSLPDLQRYFVLVFQDKKTPVESLAADLMASPNIESAEPDSIGRLDTLPTLIPNDPYFSSSNSWGQGFEDQWGLHIIRAAEAWHIEHGRTDNGKVIIAVIDNGIDWQGSQALRDEIQPNLWINTNEEPAPRNYKDDDHNGYVDDYFGVDLSQMEPDSPLPYDGQTIPTDYGGHGTHIAGIIAAKGNNGVGIAGMMWDARLMAVKTTGARGDLKSFQVAKGILYATDNGADVINMSFGHLTGSLVKRVMRYAAAQGVVLVASSGNEGEISITDRIPAGFKDVITVGASTHLDTHASYSNYGFGLDVVAPGGEQSPNLSEILSLKADAYGGDPEKIVGEFYLLAKGTSFAAPHVAGLAGLLVSKEPDLSVEEIRQRIRMTAADIEDPGWDLKTGWGRIDAYGALESSNRCIARLDSPKNESTLDYKSKVKVLGSVGGSSFKKYTLELNFDGHWKPVVPTGTAAVEKSLLADFTLSRIGRSILKLTVYDASGSRCAEDIIAFNSGFKFSHALLSLPQPSPETGQGITRMEFVKNENGSSADDLLLNRSSVAGRSSSLLAGFPNLRNNRTVPFTEKNSWDGHDSRDSFSNLGDINADGYDEIAITDHNFRHPNSRPNFNLNGRVLIKWGGVAEKYTSIEGFSRGWEDTFFLFPPVSGEMNGHGKKDLIILFSACDSCQPELYIFFHDLNDSSLSSSKSRLDASSANVQATLSYIYAIGGIGRAVSIQSGHDVNGDKRDDILINLPTSYDSNNTVASHLMLGGSSTNLSIPFRLKYEDRDRRCLGRLVDDINGDGLGDIAFGCFPHLYRSSLRLFLGKRDFHYQSSFDIIDDADGKWIMGGLGETMDTWTKPTDVLPLGDIDGDGLAELALLTKKNQIYLFMGSREQDKWHKDDFLYNADQIVDLPFTVASPTGSTVPYNQNTGDVDGNGSNDLLLAEENTNNIHILFVDDKPQSLLRPEILTGFSGYVYSGTVRMRLYNDGTENAKISALAVENKGRARLRVQSESCTGAEITPHSFCNITLQEGTSFWTRIFSHHPADLKIKANDKNADAYGNLEFPIGW